MKRKETKTKQTDSKNVNRKTVVNDVDSSRLTTHDSRSLNVSQSFIHILCIVFLILIIYSNTLNAPFQWDEGKFIVDNPIVKDLHYFTNPSDAKGFELYGHLMEPLYRLSHLCAQLQDTRLIRDRLPHCQHRHPYCKQRAGVFSCFIDIQNYILQGSRVKGQGSGIKSRQSESEKRVPIPCPLPLAP